jgi:hypothetical protein
VDGFQELTCRQLPLPPLDYTVSTFTSVTCDDTSHGGRAGGVKASCYGTGNGRNWGWAEIANGCNTWEGSRNYGYQGCACNCKIANPGVPHEVQSVASGGWNPAPIPPNPLTASASAATGGAAGGDPGCDMYQNAAGQPLFAWDSTLSKCVLQSGNLPAGPAPAAAAMNPIWACACNGAAVVLSSRNMTGEECATLGFGDAHNVHPENYHFTCTPF